LSKAQQSIFSNLFSIMFNSNLVIQWCQLGSLIAWLLIGLFGYPRTAWTQTQPHRSSIDQESIQFKQPKFPDNDAPEGRRRGGTSRGDNLVCPPLSSPITALVPGEETTGGTLSTSFLATTIAEHPTMWVYLPQLPQDNRYGEFVFQDETGQDLYRTSMTLPETGGILGIPLPSNLPALEIGKQYHWYFKLFCGEPEPQSEYFFVDAWIQRVAGSPELQTQLQAQPTPVYLIYAQHGLWYDAITELASSRHYRSDSQEDWLELMNAANLSDLSSQPILGLYQD
jgi:hypothetical protein